MISYISPAKFTDIFIRLCDRMPVWNPLSTCKNNRYNKVNLKIVLPQMLILKRAVLGCHSVVTYMYNIDIICWFWDILNCISFLVKLNIDKLSIYYNHFQMYNFSEWGEFFLANSHKSNLVILKMIVINRKLINI